MFNLYKKTPIHVGISSEETSLYFVALEHKNQAFSLCQWGATPTPTLQPANVVIAMPHHAIMIHSLELPSELEDIEIMHYIAANVQTYFGHTIEQLYIDFVKQDTQIRVVAARRDEVEKRINLLNKYGLKISVVDVESFVLERIYNTCFAWIKEQTVAAIYADSTNLLFSVLHQGKTIYARTETHDFTSITISTVLQRCLQLFTTANPQRTVQAVLCAGDLPAITIELPTYTCNLLSNIKYGNDGAFKQLANKLSMAIGLAIWQPKTSINLLPWRTLQRQKQRKILITAIIVTTGPLFLILLTIHLFLQVKIHQLTTINESLQQQITQLAKESAIKEHL